MNEPHINNKGIAYIGCLGLIGIISTEFGVIGILPQIAQHYHISIDKAGYLLSSFAMVIALTGPFIMLYAGGFNAKKVMLWATVIFLVSNLLSYTQPSYPLLILFRILPAFLQPVFISLAISAAGKGANQQMQIRYSSIVIGGIALSQVTIIPLATYISGISGWQYAYLIQAFINLLVIVLITKYVPSNPVDQAPSVGTQISIFKKPAFLISIAMNFFLIAAWFSSYSYFADYLQVVKGFNKSEISMLLLLFGLMGVVSNAVTGRMLSKNLIRTAILFVLGTIILPFILQFLPSEKWVSIISVAVWGFLYGSCFLTAIAFMQSAAHEAKAFSNTLQTSFGNLGVSIGTFVSGAFIASHSVGIAPWVGAVFGLLALCCIGIRILIDKNTK